jgi:Phasin protein
MTRMMGLPVEMWLRAQTSLLKAVEPVATGWIERRREAATAAFDALEKLSRCNDLQELCSVQRDWFEATIRRLDTDMHALADQAVVLSQEAMSATRYAAQTSSEMTGLAMQTAKQAATRTQEAVQQATEQAA